MNSFFDFFSEVWAYLVNREIKLWSKVKQVALVLFACIMVDWVVGVSDKLVINGKAETLIKMQIFLKDTSVSPYVRKNIERDMKYVSIRMSFHQWFSSVLERASWESAAKDKNNKKIATNTIYSHYITLLLTSIVFYLFIAFQAILAVVSIDIDQDIKKHNNFLIKGTMVTVIIIFILLISFIINRLPLIDELPRPLSNLLYQFASLVVLVSFLRYYKNGKYYTTKQDTA